MKGRKWSLEYLALRKPYKRTVRSDNNLYYSNWLSLGEYVVTVFKEKAKNNGEYDK
jgi:hypothetical protein